MVREHSISRELAVVRDISSFMLFFFPVLGYIFAFCLSHNSAFTGSLENLVAERPSTSTGYLPSITELKVGFRETSRSHAVPSIAKSDQVQKWRYRRPVSFMLPRIPPWFSYVGSQKLYEILAGILRLVGLSLLAGSQNDGSLAAILDIPLGCFRGVRVKEYSGERLAIMVGHLVVSNADYVVDSIFRQLRHLDLNPHVPSVLASMLSYIGVTHEILHFLEEPMRLVSQELEIVSRQQHPNLTLPFLKHQRRRLVYYETGPSHIVTRLRPKASESDAIISAQQRGSDAENNLTRKNGKTYCLN
ncbi:ARM repeat superfamily protein [Raphanus sativus]|nr:ARM repeat superfamily protein [Raphanus sativus]